MTVAVLMGGVSSEREISLRSGNAAANALLNKGYNVIKIDFKNNNIDELQKNKIDVAFIALHGRYGEDGCVQGLLELLGIPYTGSGVLSSSICMDKIMTKKILEKEEINTPKYEVVEVQDIIRENNIFERLVEKFNTPLVIKPPREGSAIGVSKVYKKSEFINAVKEVEKFDNEVLIEENIEGKELTVGIVGNKNLQLLPTIEIVSRSESKFYDYSAKYTKGMSEYIIPANITEEENTLVQNTAIKAHKVLQCRGISRADMILKNGIPYLLELNTIPGLTETSLVPKAAKYIGITFEDLVEKLIKLATDVE